MEPLKNFTNNKGEIKIGNLAVMYGDATFCIHT